MVSEIQIVDSTCRCLGRVRDSVPTDLTCHLIKVQQPMSQYSTESMDLILDFQHLGIPPDKSYIYYSYWGL